MKISALIYLILIGIKVQAQDLQIGIRGGIGFSNLYNHHMQGVKPGNIKIATGETNLMLPTTSFSLPIPYYETSLWSDLNTGYFSEIFLNWKLNKRWNLELGIGYNQKGIDMEYQLAENVANSDFSKSQVFSTSNYDYRIGYLYLPKVIQYNLDRKQRLYVLGGIYSSFALNFKIHHATTIERVENTYQSGNGGVTSTSAYSSDQAYARIFDSGLIGGIGIKWPVKDHWTLGLDVRGTFGLIRVPAKYEQSRFFIFSPDAKNMGIEAGLKVGYQIQ